MSNVSIPSPECVAASTGDELIRFALVMPRDEQLEPLFYDVQIRRRARLAFGRFRVLYGFSGKLYEDARPALLPHHLSKLAS
jgi:hypothetical protein